MITSKTFKKLDNINGMKVEVVCKNFIPLVKGAGYNLLSGRGGTGKSMIALRSVVSYLRETEGTNALAIFTEDGKKEIDGRLWTICKNEYSMSRDEFREIRDRIFFMTIENIEPIDIIGDFENIVKFMRVENISFVVLDPLKFFHKIDENSNTEIDAIMRYGFSKLSIITGAVVLVLHHSSKGAVGARGASTIEDTSRVAYSIATAFKKLKDGTLVVDEDYKGLVKLFATKDNYNIFKECRCLDSEGMLEVFPKGSSNNVTVIEMPML